jgi:hypothetical protein
MRQRGEEIAHSDCDGADVLVVAGVDPTGARERVDHREPQRLVDQRVDVVARRARQAARFGRARGLVTGFDEQRFHVGLPPFRVVGRVHSLRA